MKRHYSAGMDLLAAVQRKVLLQQPASSPLDSPASDLAAAELVLYDPEAHRVQLQVMQAELALQQNKQSNLQDHGSGATVADEASLLGGAPSTASDALSGSTVPSSGLTASGPDMSGWGQRVKVCADRFLVEKLRPHQREGVRYVGTSQP